MSAIKDGRLPITLDKERHMLFSLNAIDAVEDKIGDIGNLEEEMNKKGRMKLIKWLFTLLLNEGAAFTKYLETGTTEGAEVLTEDTVGLLLNGVNLTSMTSNIYKSLALSSKGDADAPEEPQEDEEGNTEAGKEN